MGLLHHHMTISQSKCQTCVVNRYAIYTCYFLITVSRLLEIWGLFIKLLKHKLKLKHIYKDTVETGFFDTGFF